MHPLTASPEAKEQWLSPFTGAFSERITSLALERRGLAQPELTTAVLQDLDAVGEDLPSLVRSTAEFDYVNGCAGTLAALAAVPHFSLSDDARTALASELQQRRTDLVDWTDPTGQLGLAHGWAGRMVGLVAADRLLGGSPATAEAVRSGLGRYLAARPLDTAMVDPASATSWCKGATGVLIALVLALEHTGHTHGQIMERIRRELRRATCSPSPGAVDISLCHGVAGQIAVVTWIGRRLSQPDLLVRARRLRCAAAEQIRRDRWRSGLAQVPETDSYFLGRSGWEHASMNLENPRWTLPMVTGGDLG